MLALGGMVSWRLWLRSQGNPSWWWRQWWPVFTLTRARDTLRSARLHRPLDALRRCHTCRQLLLVAKLPSPAIRTFIGLILLDTKLRAVGGHLHGLLSKWRVRGRGIADFRRPCTNNRCTCSYHRCVYCHSTGKHSFALFWRLVSRALFCVGVTLFVCSLPAHWRIVVVVVFIEQSASSVQRRNSQRPRVWLDDSWWWSVYELLLCFRNLFLAKIAKIVV